MARDGRFGTVSFDSQQNDAQAWESAYREFARMKPHKEVRPMRPDPPPIERRYRAKVLGYGESERRCMHRVAYRTRGNRKCYILHRAAHAAQLYNRVWAGSWGWSGRWIG